MATLHYTIDVNASPDQAWTVVGDLAGVATWIPGIADVKVNGGTRVCTLANGAVQHEQILDYSAADRSYGYTIQGSPLPVKSNRGRFAVEAHGEGARVQWQAELEFLDSANEEQVLPMVDGAFKEVANMLRQRIEEYAVQGARLAYSPARRHDPN